MQQRAAAEDSEEEGEEHVEEAWTHTNGYDGRQELSRPGRLGPLSNGPMSRSFAPVKRISKPSESRQV